MQQQNPPQIYLISSSSNMKFTSCDHINREAKLGKDNKMSNMIEQISGNSQLVLAESANSPKYIMFHSHDREPLTAQLNKRAA